LIRRVVRLTPSKAVMIARQVGEGLIEAHRHGVIHRDLKPQNIMIDTDGNARIMDFGISRFVLSKGQTEMGLIVGTPEYMSPEQVDGKTLDGRSDIYSLGIILFEMLTGRVPFEGETPFSIAVKHKTEEPESPSRINSVIPEDLSRLILKCLEKNRDKRLQKPEELVQALREMENSFPTTEKEITKRKTLPPREITVRFSLRKIGIPVLALAFVLTGILLLKLFPGKSSGPGIAGHNSLAVMYFENSTGLEDLDHWRKALSDLLIADLSQSKYLSVLSSEVMTDYLKEMDLLTARNYSLADIREIARRSGIRYALVGKIFMADNVFRLNTQLLEARTGRVVDSETVEGTGEESVFVLVDDLTKRIKQDFQLSADEIASDIDEDVGKLTTTSPEALKYYRNGLKFYENGEYTDSISALETAVALDPAFAMAYRALAGAYTSLGYESEARDRLKRAFDRAENLSSREKFSIQGQFYSRSERNFDKAIEAYNQVLVLSPDDFLANRNLGLIYLRLEEWDKAIRHLNTNRRNGDQAVQTYFHLAEAYRLSGKIKKATGVLRIYLRRHGDRASIRLVLAGLFLERGQGNDARRELDAAYALDPTDYKHALISGNISLVEGDYKAAENEYLKLLDFQEPIAHDSAFRSLSRLYLLQGRISSAVQYTRQGIELAEMLGQLEWKAWHTLQMGYLLTVQGENEEALKVLNAALATAVLAERMELQRNAFQLKGLVYLQLKRVDDAGQTAVELKDLIEKGIHHNALRQYLQLKSAISLSLGEIGDAVREAEAAVRMLPERGGDDFSRPLYAEQLGSAFFAAGRLAHAEDVFQDILSDPYNRLSFGDRYAAAFLWQARIQKKRDNQQKADDFYRSFLSLWEDADSGLPGLEEARRELN
ncbi:MAG: protein kinase, partial [Candidatus Aminicenantes bacterium]|nr:protein kinase [Candidatus Aminicenantes bacterium]